MYASINQDLTLIKMVNILFDESFFFINYGMNIFFEWVIISIGLYWLEMILNIPKEDLL